MAKYETERMLIEEATLKDAEFFFQLLNSPNWLEFIGDRNIQTIQDAQMYIHSSLINSYEKNGFGLYKMTLKENKQTVGICGLVKRPRLQHPDIGFAILPDFAGKGYTTEAALATLDFAHHKLNINTILAITTENNVKSRHLLKKIGMKFIETITFEENKQEYLLYNHSSFQ